MSIRNYIQKTAITEKSLVTFACAQQFLIILKVTIHSIMKDTDANVETAKKFNLMQYHIWQPVLESFGIIIEITRKT